MGGGGGQKFQKFSPRGLWMTPYIDPSAITFASKYLVSFVYKLKTMQNKAWFSNFDCIGQFLECKKSWLLFIDACKTQCGSAPVITDRDGCKAACQHCIPQCNYDKACLEKCAKIHKNSSESIQATNKNIKLQASFITTTIVFTIYKLLLK